ncbi:hypothetical protein B0H14DRAFT_3856888 [Mycena olivaceomarginata]|nr:hypothetical protein B0H14DRAFT_3856888 [Mycena olivaceomarginata]
MGSRKIWPEGHCHSNSKNQRKLALSLCAVLLWLGLGSILRSTGKTPPLRAEFGAAMVQVLCCYLRYLGQHPPSVIRAFEA